MTGTDTLGDLAGLATALGLLDASGDFETDWLKRPGDFLGSVLAQEHQRDALIDVVDELLGGSERRTDADGRVWLPLVSETSPDVTVSLVVDDTPTDHVRIGVGVELRTTGPTSRSTAHLPLFKAAKAGPGGTDPMLLGTSQGRLQAATEITVDDAAPTPGQAHLAGIGLSVDVPTGAGGADPVIGLTLRGLRLAGATTSRDLHVSASDVDDLDDTVLELVLGLLEAQAQALGGPLAAIAGILGLRSGVGVPAFPIDDLATTGISALAAWFRDVVDDLGSRAAWLGQLALAVGGTPAGDAIELTLGAATVSIGVGVTTDAGGQPVVTPRLALSVAAGADVRVRVTTDLARLDLGPGTATALPALAAFVELGRRADGAGTRLLTGDPQVDALRAGIVLDPQRRPTFLLSADRVVIAGHNYPSLDLTDGDTLAETATSLLTDVIADLLAQIGPAGDRIAQLFGLRPPTGHPTVPTIDLAAFLGDPLDAVRGHWRSLVTTHAAAVPALLTHLRDLLADASQVTAAVSGAGSVADPWLVPLVGPVGLRLHRDAGGVLHVAVAARYVVDTLGRRCTRVTTQLAADVVALDLDTGSANFLASVELSLNATGRLPGEARIDLGALSVVAQHVGLLGRWTPTGGLEVDLDTPGLAIRTELGDVPIVLPTLDAAGHLTLDAAGWTALEALLGLLVEHAGDLAGEVGLPPAPWLKDLLGALGWSATGGPRLSLAAASTDLHRALADWLSELLLAGGDALQGLVEAVGRLLAGSETAFAHVSGTGRPADPYLVHLASVPGSPALAAWTVPDGPPLPPTLVPDELKGWLPGLPGLGVDLLADALAADARLADRTAGLLRGRSGLAAGLVALSARWLGSDGLIVPPGTDPTGVTVHRLPDRTAPELPAAIDLADLLGTAPETVVRVAVVAADVAEPWPGRPRARVLDLRAGGLAPAAFALPAAAAGEWFVALGDRDAARLATGDADGTAGQAARLARVLGPFAAVPGQLALLADGGAGHAARAAANTVGAVDAVVTLGTPLGPVAFSVLDAPPGADALRLLAALLPAPDPADPDEADLARARMLTGELLALLRLADPSRDLRPPAAGIPAPRAGLASHAVFGVLGADAIARALTAVVAADLSVRAQARFDAPPPAPTGVRVGLHLPVSLTEGTLVADGHALIELGGLDLGVGLAAPTASTARSVRCHLEVRRSDGWLIGGPDPLSGTRAEHELRALEADVVLPLGGTTPAASASILLHEPTTFGVRRPRWVVRPAAVGGPGGGGLAGEAVTPALPEVRVLLSQVAARLSALTGPARPVADLLSALGILSAGGSVPDAVDNLLHDPAAHLAAALTSRRAAVESALAALLAPLTGVAVDLANGSVAVSLASSAGLAAWNLTATVAATGSAVVTASVGTGAAAAASSAAGGLEVTLSSGTGAADLRLHRPGHAPAVVPLWPSADADALLALLVDVLPAQLGRLGLEHLRRLDPGTRPVVDAIYDTLGLLGPMSTLAGERPVLLPFGLLRDPVGWLAHSGAFGGSGGLDPAKVAAFLDALKPILGLTGAPGRWDLATGVALAVSGPSGALALDLSVDTAALVPPPASAARLSATVGLGLTVSAGAPTPRASLALGLPGGAPGRRAVHVQLSGTSVSALFRPATGADIALYPDPPGLGQLAQTAVTQALPLVLDELAGQSGTDVAGRAGEIVRTVGDALGLRTTVAPIRFDGARLSAFAADPVQGLVGALPTLTAGALNALASALGPVLPGGATAAVVAGELRVAVAGITLGWQPAPLRVTVGAAVSSIPVVEDLAATVTLTPTGLAALVVEVGPGDIDAGVARLRPVLGFAVGTSPAGGRRVDLGLAVDAAGTSSVRARWDLTAGTVALVVDDAGVPTTSPADVAIALLDVVLDLAAGFALQTTAVTALLNRPVGGTTVRNLLRAVVLEDVANPSALDDDLFDPDRLLGRVQQLVGNLAGTNPTLTIPGGLTVGLAQAGPLVQLVVGIAGRADLTSGDVVVSVEADSRWIRNTPAAGLAIGLLDTAGGLSFAPSLACHGLGLRISRSSGPLLDTVVTLGSVAFHLFGSITGAGVGAGIQVQLSDLAVATGGAEGGNAIASGMLADANASGQELAPAFSPALAVQKHPGTGVLVSLSAGEGSGPWWLAIQTGFGPLYVEQVGLGVTVAQEKLVDISLLLDARVSLFGLTAAVDDLEITYVVATNGLAVDLAGLAIAADISGVSLAGGLRKFGSGETTEYIGMLLGRFGVYGLSVYGGYGKGVANGSTFASFFAFGAVNGPIGGPPAFFITGIGGGIGINRGINLPTDLSRLGEFPLLKALDPAATPSSDPMAELAKVRSDIPMQRGQFWFAAGISFTSFALVDGIAALVIEVGDGLEIALLGLARMALPRPQVALVSIELGLIARFSSSEGVLWIQAQLTDNSWLLHESIRLTGGFAFVSWFSGAKAGEFVLTMGGYHPSFHRDGYPQVPRLGYRWEVSNNIVIKGENYFALTSEALMAGGSFEASAKFGPAWAKITFGADGIVYFDPFRFEVTVYARISAGVTIDVWIGEITIKVSLGARITVSGPKIRGTASFEIGPVDLSVSFGDTAKHPKVFVSWAEFTTKYLEEAAPGVARVLSSIPGKGALPPGTGPSGSEAGTADGSAAHPYEVLSEFELTVVTTVPTTTFTFGAKSRTTTASGVIGIAPVNIGSATTEVRLQLRNGLNQDQIGVLDAAAPLVGSFPAGVWGPPQPDEDKKIPQGEIITAGNGLTLVAEAALRQTLPPEIAYHQVETGPRKPLPLIPERAARPLLLSQAGRLAGLLPPITDVDAVFALAAQWLSNGGRSATTVAALAGDRVAVPLLGSLTEGLAAIEGRTPDLTLHEPAGPRVVDSEVRAPVAVAILSGAAAVAGPALAGRVRTTVQDPRGATGLRPPSLAEVRASAQPAVPMMLSLVNGGAVAEGTMLARDRTPLTRGAAGASGAVAIRGADPAGQAVLAGLTAGLAGGRVGAPAGADAAPAPPARLVAGEIAILRLPNARKDVGAQRARPRLLAEGAPARLVALGFGGEVLADLAHPESLALTLPPQTERIVALSEGVVDPNRLAGWHGGQEVAFVGWATALVPGGVLALEGAGVRRHRQRRQAGWIEAAELVRDADIVRTSFAERVRTLVVVLEGVASGGDPVGLDLILTGAAGRGRPTLVASGNRSMLVYDVQPEAKGVITVSIARQAGWTVAGVLASRGPAGSIAQSLHDGGLDRLVRPLAGPSTGKPVRLRWEKR